MSYTKRRDNKGRVLQMGEIQLEDGRYAYRYTDPFGQRKTVYSWRLTASDSMPAGKRKDKALRDKIKDIDFKKKVIKVNHQLQRTNDMKYICETTKTVNGVREVPMTPDVMEAFRRIIKMRPKLKVEPIIDGYSGFLFLDKNGKPKVALHWEKYFQLSVAKYNMIYRVQLPKITPHVCRHTFCTNMAKSGMNPKVLQYIMGHGDISVTLDTYTHIKSEDAIAEMERLDYLKTKEA